MLFKVRNEGSGPRFVVTEAGRTRVDPGEKNEKKLNMDPAVARQYIAMAKRGGNFSIKISGLDDAGRAELEKPIEPRERKGMPPGYRAPQSVKPAAQPAVASPYDEVADDGVEKELGLKEGVKPVSAKAELFSRADEMELDQLRTEAAMVLGKAWPKSGAKLSKPKIKALLAAE